MAVVIYAPHKDGHHDGSIAKQTQAFIRKLYEDDTLPGLHIEPINAAIDPKVRTGRVNDMYRAVLFKVQASGGQPHYVFTGVWPHDEAIKIASRSVLKTNPVNGLPELLMAAAVAVPRQGSAADRAEVGVAPAAGEATRPLLGDVPGVSLDRLIRKLGIDPELAARAMEATTEDELMTLAESAVTWQGLALLDLAAGLTIDEVRAKLALDQAPDVEVDASAEEKLLAGLRAPTARMQFAWLEDDEELRQVIEGGDFATWRVFLHPEQRKYAESAYNGAFRLSGGAGTGKTVVLIHRARMLARRDPAARVVLTTFTRNLAESLRRSVELLDPSVKLARTLGEPGIFVTGVDAAANAVVSSAAPEAVSAAVERVLSLDGNRDVGRRTDEQAAWKEAIEAAGERLPSELRSPIFFAGEYASVVLPGRITTRDDYLRARRAGRGVALGRAQRAAVWDVVAAYRAAGAVEGSLDFGEIAAVAAEIGPAAPGHLADHVLVDEGQDLTPTQWQFLRSLVAEGPDDLFIAEDSQQRIYGQRVVLGRHGIRIVGRSRRLSLNYRTTEQVLRFASGVLAGTQHADLDGEVTDGTGYRSARSGPSPKRVPAASLAEELDAAANHVKEWLHTGVEPEAIGILVRDQQMVSTVERGLGDRGVALKAVGRGAVPRGKPQLMTMHRAKGMEFSRVLIFGVDAGLVPADYLLRGVPDGDRDDLLQRERSLFYVAATRARDELVVMWEGPGSEFLGGGASA